MGNTEFHNSLLHRYWFETRAHLGFGVTAYSEEDARSLIDEVIDALGWDLEVLRIVVDVDVRGLDQSHVIPNMGSPNLMGVWYPMLKSLS